MTAANTRPGTGWQITHQEPLQKIGPGNTVQDGVQVHFRTQYGAEGAIWLPQLNYTAENVRAAVIELATTMDDVHTLIG